MKQIVFYRKMHSNQEMVDYGNECSRNQIFLGWNRCARWSLNFGLPVRSFGLVIWVGHPGWPILVYTPLSGRRKLNVLQSGLPDLRSIK